MMTNSVKPTDSELEILNILWDHQPLTVRDVHEKLAKESGYTTTLKLMQIMHEKGLLSRNEESRSHLYSTAVKREQTQDQYIKKMINSVFKGSAMQLVMQALGNHKPSEEELQQIKRYIAEQEKNKG